jgi:hypothetical protein
LFPKRAMDLADANGVLGNSNSITETPRGEAHVIC